MGEQLTRDLMLVYLDRGVLPEMVTLVLRPKGRLRVPGRRRLRSRLKLSSCRLKWRVVELWTLTADQLFGTQDVGLIPWVPLTDSAEPPETLVQRCRELIDERAVPGERDNLLAVTQVLTRLRYNDLSLLTILGGRKTMIESPLIDELFAEKAREISCQTASRNVLTILETRFGAVPDEVADQVRSVADDDRLTDLVRKAASCHDLESFRDALGSE